MFCKNCGKQINGGDNFCKYCDVEIKTKKEPSSIKIKNCPFCKKEINSAYEECPNCGRMLIEKIPSAQIFSESVKKVITGPKSSFVKRLNYPKIIKYLLIVLIIFFIIWVLSSEDKPSYKEGSPTSITKISEPEEIERNYNSLPNETIIYLLSHYFTGSGELEINNGTDYDAVVKLIKTSIDKSIYTAYIKAKNSHTINKIPDGRYTLLFMHGKDWDGINQTFLVDKSYSKFRDDFDFITREVNRYDGIYEEYTIYEITLHPVFGGTAQTSDISENEFDKYN